MLLYDSLCLSVRQPVRQSNNLFGPSNLHIIIYIVDKYMYIPEKGSLLEVCPIYNNIYFKTSYFSYKNILSVSLKSRILYFLCVIINLDPRYKKIYWLGHALSKKISC